MINARELKIGNAYIVTDDFLFNERKQINKGDIFICIDAYRDYDGIYAGEFERDGDRGWKFYFKSFHKNLSEI